MRSLIFLVALFPSGAAAQQCQSYVGTSPNLTSIAEALDRFDGVTPKDEFETTAQYEMRIAAATGGNGPIVVPKALDQDQLTYNADLQAFKIGQFVFDNANMPVDDLWSYGGPFYESGNYQSRRENIDVVIRQDEQTTGSYGASNSFGAKTEVVQVDRTFWGIYERPVTQRGRSSFRASYLVPVEEERDHIGMLPMPASEAREFKSSAQAAIVALPKGPWKISYRNRSRYGPTIRNPLEVTNVLNVLFADIQCALILDGNGKAVSAFETR